MSPSIGDLTAAASARASWRSPRCSTRRRPALPDGRRDLVGLSRAELAAELAAIGEKPFRTKQLWHWIYHQGVTDFSRMSIDRAAVAAEAGRALRGRPAGGGGRADQRG